MEELHKRLREAAQAHQPDRERILARVERGMAPSDMPLGVRPPARRASWPRIAAVTAAVSGALVAGAYAVTSVLPDNDPAGGTATAASPLATASNPPKVSHTPDPAPRGGADRKGRADGPLRSRGAVDPHSNDFWAQNNLTLETTRPLDQLTVDLLVRLTPGVSSTGTWRTLPEADFTHTVTERDGYLLHRWELKPGRTVPEGRHEFAAQYDHARGGRDATGDRYTITGRQQNGQLARVTGDFSAQDG
ncbi:hypothetical protein [Streptomyces sp. NPDC002851]